MEGREVKLFFLLMSLSCLRKYCLIIFFSADIPPGIEDGQVLRIDIDPEVTPYLIDQQDYFYAYFQVDSSSHFTRENCDIYSEADISLAQALLGGSFSVPGLHKESLSVEVPELTSSHRTLVVRDGGVRRSGTCGHHFVKVGIRVPKSLSARQRDVWRRFAETELVEGTVQGCQSPMDHKFEIGVVEATSVKRPFNVKKMTDEEKRKKLKGEDVDLNLFQRMMKNMKNEQS